MSLNTVVSRADAQEVLLLDEESLDPNMTYRWVLNLPANLGKRQGQGYRLVSRKDDKVKLLIPEDKSPDDFYHHGDSILMCCPTSVVNERRRKRSALATERLGTPVSQFTKQHEASGVRNSRVLVDEEGERK